MKKILLSAAVCTLALGFSSCSETWDDNPVLNTHEGEKTANFLNNPVMQDQTIMLTNGNKEGTFHLTCSQPDFGYAAVATYKVQCSLTEDFAKYEEISQDFYNCAEVNPVNGDVAAAIQKLSGVKTEADLPLPYQKLYMRLRAFVAQSESNTQYLSNVVSFAGVSSDYLAIWVSDVPVNIYLLGGMNNWGNDGLTAEWQFATGADENTWVTPVVTIPAGTEFKVADSSWGSINLGAGAPQIVAGEEYALAASDAGNIVMSADFTGVAHLKLEKGNYILTLDPK
uniref:SusE outer membrane protein domain-containing protein n=1 Tax=uncultured Muribaculaceae bacterium TaxID=2301481 RepID=A0A6G8F4C5_9BACT|nr:hypothetical protein Muribac1_0500 [uncultured Muribaculaceae bacterium]